jgi:hypothetical protein
MTLLKAARILVEKCPANYPYGEHFVRNLSGAVPAHLRNTPDRYARAEHLLWARAWMLVSGSR